MNIDELHNALKSKHEIYGYHKNVPSHVDLNLIPKSNQAKLGLSKDSKKNDVVITIIFVMIGIVVTVVIADRYIKNRRERAKE